MKLNLGCGFDHKDGWVNADIDPRTNAGLLLDLEKKLPFADDSVEEILLQDVLEHVTKEHAIELLSECRRILSPRGSITIRIPNIDQIYHQFHSDPEVMFEFMYGTTDKNGVWGAHKFGYNQETITKTLKGIGFSKIQVEAETTNWLVTAEKKKKLVNPHILIIQQSPDWGGAEEWMTHLVKHWSHKNINISAITNHSRLKKEWKQSGASVQHLPYTLDIIGNYKGLIKTALVIFPALLFYLSHLIRAKKQGVNLILMSGFSEKLLVSWLAKLIGIPIVWYEYGPIDQVLKRNLYLPKVMYRLTKHIPEKVLTISENTKRKLIPSTRLSLAKLKVIYPGVQIPKTEANSKDLIVGSLSRLTEEKGQRILIKAWKEVVKKIPKAKLKIAGRGPDEEKIRNLINELDLSDSIELVGFVEDKTAFYSQLSLFVFPSIWEMEGFGLVQTEAMSHGIPVVAFNHGPSPEILDHQRNLLIDHTDLSNLAERIVYLLSHKDLDLTDELSQKCRIRAQALFDVTTQSQKVLNEIQTIVNQTS